MADESHPIILKLLSLGISPRRTQIGKSSLVFELEVVAKPGSRKEGISLTPEGLLKIAVAARPVEGAANEAISKYLAVRLGISASSIGLAGGPKSKTKRFLVTYLFTDRKDINYYLGLLDHFLGS